MSADSISQAIVAMFETQRFYAEIIASMSRKLSKDVPMAGVCIKDTIELHINPEAFEKLPLAERVAVLMHECEHILRDHIPRAKYLAPEIFEKSEDFAKNIISGMKFKSLNMAMDMAINDGIPNVPKWGVFSKAFNLESGHTMEWYMTKLKDNEKAKSFMEFDDHSLWSQSEGQEDILKEKVRAAVNAAARRAKAAGQLTSDQELLVDRMNANLIEWKAQLRRFVARSSETKAESSRKKRNRRFGIAYPGYVKEEVLHIGVAVDTSGSISNEALNQFMAEVHKISKYAKVTVVEADSEVKNTYIYDPKKPLKLKGGGGTAYQPALDYFTDETDVDGLIYFGDGDCFDNKKLKKPKYPVLWALVGEQPAPADFGTTIRVKV